MLLEDSRVKLVVLSCDWPLAGLHCMVQTSTDKLSAVSNAGPISADVPLKRLATDNDQINAPM